MTPKFIATRNFKDSGSEREFEAGPMPDDVDAGVLANYLAAGLIRVPGDDDAIAADPAPVTEDKPAAAKKPARRTAAKRAAPKSAASKLN